MPGRSHIRTAVRTYAEVACGLPIGIGILFHVSCLVTQNALGNRKAVYKAMKKFYFLITQSLRKSVTCAAIAALMCNVSLASCEKEKDAQTVYDMLQGTWVTTHAKGHDYLIDATTGVYKWKDDFDENINDITSEKWMKFTLDRNNKVTILELGDPEDLVLPAVLNYSFNGKQLGGMVFSGDFTTYMTIIDISDTELVLELDDKGTDEDGINDFYAIYTFKKVDE